MRVATAVAVLSVLAGPASPSRVPRRAAMAPPSQGPLADTFESVDRRTDVVYDYIVVGSGPGGGPLAANLAIGGYKVLLIDAGGDSGTDLTETLPALHLFATELEETRWDFYVQHYADAERQKKDSKMTYRNVDGSLYVGLAPAADAEPLGVLYPRTGTLGGCSRHNALITIGAHDGDWEHIANLTGDESWRAANMRRYLEAIERNEYVPSSVAGHGHGGWLATALTSLSLVVEDRKLLSLIVACATAMGQGLLGLAVATVVGLGEVLLRDVNAPGQASRPGLYQVPLAMADNVRGGPREFVLQTAGAVSANGTRRYHLDVRLNTLVTRVRFDRAGERPRAVGVDYLEGASLYRADPRAANATVTGRGSVDAAREVIVAGGAFNSPQLLKLSGIGPAAELAALGIATLVDLPGVGANMQDRYEATVVGQNAGDFAITSRCTFLQTLPDPCLAQYEAGVDPVSRGVYGTSGIAIAAVLRSSVAADEPDLLVSGAPARFVGYYPGYAADALADARHWAWIVLKAHSRNNAGTVTLRSADPRDTPLIQFRSLDTGVNGSGEADQDLQALYEGFQFGRNVFRDLVPLDGAFAEVWPGANVSAEADVKAFLASEAWGHHASCTCAIGADDDANAVLTSDFKVRGTDGLRVVDASVFPAIPGFYIALPLYMVSQKASEVILQEAAAS